MPKQPQAQPNWFQKFMDLGLDNQYTPQPRWYGGAGESLARTGQIPKPKGDAVKRIRENTFKDSKSTSTTTDVETQQKTKEMISPKTLETLVETLNEFPLTSSKELVSGLEEYQKIKDEIAKAKANTQVNLMPLMALSDMWYGGNLAKTYTPPTSKDDYLKMQAELEGATQQARVGLSKEDIDLANTLLSNFYIAGTDTKEIDKKDEVKGVGNTIINVPPALQPREPAPKAPSKVDLGDTDVQKLINTKQAQTYEKLMNYVNKINNYDALLKKHGVSANPFSEGYSELNTATAEIQIAYKEAAALGALTGPDMGLIINALGSATSPMAAAKQTVTGKGVQDLVGKMKQLKENAKFNFEYLDNTLRRAYDKQKPTQLLDDWKKQSSGLVGGGNSEKKQNQQSKAQEILNKRKNK